MTVRAGEGGEWLVEHAEHVPADAARSWTALPPGPADTPLGRVRVKPDASSPLRWLGHRWLGRPLRCQRALRLGPALRAAGVPCPEPLAALVHAASGRARLVSRDLPGRDLADLLEAGVDPADLPWPALAEAVARLHRAGLRQRDLKAPNVLVDGAAVALLDLDGVEPVGAPAPERTRRADLGRLAASVAAAVPADARDATWTRFLELYLAAFEGRAASAGALAEAHAGTVARWRADTLRRAERKAARNRRRGRPLR